MALAQFIRSENKNARRVRNGEKCSKGEKRSTDETPRVIGRYEVQKGGSDHADEDRVSEPFLGMLESIKGSAA